MFALSKNDHFAPALYQPFEREPLSGEFFREVIALLPGVFLDPQASRPSDICPEALLYVILACLINVYACVKNN